MTLDNIALADGNEGQVMMLPRDLSRNNTASSETSHLHEERCIRQDKSKLCPERRE